MSGSDMEPRARQLVNPVTAEVLDLATATPGQLGEFITVVDEAITQLKDVRAVAAQEVLRHMNFAAKGTLHAAGFKLSAPKGTEDQWDGADLRTRLLELVDDGTLSIEAVDAAVAIETTYTVKKRGVNALTALGGVPKQIVDELRTEVPKGRPVKVEDLRGGAR